MSIKVITGVPGSGKSFFAVKEVISKHFEWNDDFNQWVNKTGVTIISNINGLRLPHVRFKQYLREEGIDYRRFFTVNYFDKILIPRFHKVVILLDEAQKMFPTNFKDVKGAEDNPEELSNFYFFEYHRHLSSDVYIIGQLWTRFSPNIVNLSEYQIDAQRRSLSVVGEFKYFFRNGFEVYYKKTLKPDKKIFALYQSTDTEENKGGEIRPIRRLAIFIAVGFLCVFISGKYLIHRMTGSSHENHVSNVDKVSKPVVPLKAAAIGRVETAAAIGSKPLPLPESVTRIKLGGMWFGKRLVGIEFFGRVVPVSEFTYHFEANSSDLTVVADIPDGILGQVQRAQTGDFYRDGSRWSKIGTQVSDEKSKFEEDESRSVKTPKYLSRSQYD